MVPPPKKPRKPKTKPNDQNFPGAALVNAINTKGIERGLTLKNMSELIGLSYVYFVSLTNGKRMFSGLARPRLQAIANFLEVPLVRVYILAEILCVGDFIYQVTLEDQLNLSITKMRADKIWGVTAPSPVVWDATPMDAKLQMIFLYERMSGQVLLEKADAGKVVDPDQEDN
jgi:hypothetical protein